MCSFKTPYSSSLHTSTVQLLGKPDENVVWYQWWTDIRSRRSSKHSYFLYATETWLKRQQLTNLGMRKIVTNWNLITSCFHCVPSLRLLHTLEAKQIFLFFCWNNLQKEAGQERWRHARRENALMQAIHVQVGTRIPNCPNPRSRNFNQNVLFLKFLDSDNKFWSFKILYHNVKTLLKL